MVCSLYVSETFNVSEVSTSEVCVQSSDELKQNVVVTFPNHFQVPEALKSGLKFGSFGSDFGKRDGFSRTDGDNNASPALHSSQGSDKTATSRFVVNVCCVVCLSTYRSLSLSSLLWTVPQILVGTTGGLG